MSGTRDNETLGERRGGWHMKLAEVFRHVETLGGDPWSAIRELATVVSLARCHIRGPAGVSMA